MSKLVKIDITKATLYLYESELVRVIPPELMVKALRRGKWQKRKEQAEKRTAEKEYKGR